MGPTDDNVAGFFGVLKSLSFYSEGWDRTGAYHVGQKFALGYECEQKQNNDSSSSNGKAGGWNINNNNNNCSWK
jgi:hypothetical protein